MLESNSFYSTFVGYIIAGEAPVGTANVGLECGDIRVWPDFEPPIPDDPWTPAVQRQFDRGIKKQLTGYKQVFPKWERFFRNELGFSLTPTRGP